jgi:succinyl-CoA synthetase beta subunit
MPTLFEFEGKRVFEKMGITVPKGKAVTTPKEARETAEMVGKPVVIKVQTPTGKRGKAGGIKFADTPEEAEKWAAEFLGKPFRDFTVKYVLVEEKLDIKEEFYVGAINDRSAKAPALIVSSQGGMDVEEIARNYPDKIARCNVDILRGLQVYQARKLVKDAGVPNEYSRGVTSFLYRLYWNVYRKYDAVFTEINPLVVTADDRVIAADSRLMIDDDSMYRHKDLQPEAAKMKNERELFASERGFGYVELNKEGDIACVANGAGLGMTVMDYIHEATKIGTMACFLDVGARFYGLAGDALKLVLQLPKLKAVLFHSYGGVTRADILADSVCKAIKEIKPKVPIFLQVSGIGEKAAIELMKKESPEFRKAGYTIAWSSHGVNGTEDESAVKGGVDVLENPVKKCCEWAGYEYKRSPPDWIKPHPEWEESGRKHLKEALAKRPEPEWNTLAQYE